MLLAEWCFRRCCFGFGRLGEFWLCFRVLVVGVVDILNFGCCVVALCVLLFGLSGLLGFIGLGGVYDCFGCLVAEVFVY